MPVQRFLVLTTQHSGSSWLTDELDAQPGVACRRELLIDLDEHRLQRKGNSLIAPTWEEWVARAEAEMLVETHGNVRPGGPSYLVAAAGTSAVRRRGTPRGHHLRLAT